MLNELMQLRIPMRTAIACLFLASTSVLAASPSEQFDPVQFEKRFHKADANKDGQLSRKEAYAEFPRMPEFFDEIDSNRDSAITLLEVKQTLERRVDAAFTATSRYDSPPAGTGEIVPAQEPMPLGELETRRAYRQQYYESLMEEEDRARDLGEVVPTTPSSPLLEKRY
jgi:hypothetical protein